jgi:hypothetical protein
MHLIPVREGLEEFEYFCRSFDVKEIIAEFDEHGNVEAVEKEIYALAILRAIEISILRITDISIRLQSLIFGNTDS